MKIKFNRSRTQIKRLLSVRYRKSVTQSIETFFKVVAYIIFLVVTLFPILLCIGAVLSSPEHLQNIGLAQSSDLALFLFSVFLIYSCVFFAYLIGALLTLFPFVFINYFVEKSLILIDRGADLKPHRIIIHQMLRENRRLNQLIRIPLILIATSIALFLVFVFQTSGDLESKTVLVAFSFFALVVSNDALAYFDYKKYFFRCRGRRRINAAQFLWGETHLHVSFMGLVYKGLLLIWFIKVFFPAVMVPLIVFNRWISVLGELDGSAFREIHMIWQSIYELVGFIDVFNSYTSPLMGALAFGSLFAFLLPYMDASRSVGVFFRLCGKFLFAIRKPIGITLVFYAIFAIGLGERSFNFISYGGFFALFVSLLFVRDFPFEETLQTIVENEEYIELDSR